MCGWGGSASKAGKRVPGWCEGMRWIVDGRPGADSLNVSRGVRNCPLQQIECPKGNSGGTAEKFRPESVMTQGVSYFQRSEEYGKRITKNL